MFYHNHGFRICVTLLIGLLQMRRVRGITVLTSLELSIDLSTLYSYLKNKILSIPRDNLGIILYISL